MTKALGIAVVGIGLGLASRGALKNISKAVSFMGAPILIDKTHGTREPLIDDRRKALQ